MAKKPRRPERPWGAAEAEPPRVRLTASERREGILAAARDVFLRRSAGGARIREISQVAGVNEALLYRHFESKEQLFQAAIVQPLDETIEKLLQQGPEAGPEVWSSPQRRVEQVTAVIDTLLDGVLDIAPLLSVVLSGEAEDAEDTYRTRIVPAIETLSDAVESVRRHWGYPGVDARLVVISALGVCMMLALDDRFGGSFLDDRERVVGEIACHIIYGLEGPSDYDVGEERASPLTAEPAAGEASKRSRR